MKNLRALVAVLAIAAVGVVSSACAAPQQTGDPVANAIHANFGDNATLEAQATKVAKCESGLNPNAYNPSGYYGLFQLSKYWQEKTANAMGYTWAQIDDPAVNAKVARAVYNSAGGWGAWGCKP